MKNNKTIIIVLIMLLLAIFFPFKSVYADTIREIKIGCIDYSGFIDKNVDGTYTGYGVEYLNEISKYTGWKYTYDFDTPENCLKKLENGDIDFICNAQFTEERSHKYLFSSYSAGDEVGIIYALPSNSNIYFNDLQAFNDKKIGVLKNSFEMSKLKEYAENNDFTYTSMEYDSVISMKQALKNGEIDLLVMGSLAYDDELKVVSKFSTAPFYFMSAKDDKHRELIEQVDDALEQIKTMKPYLDAQLYEKYYGNSTIALQPELTRDEVLYANNCKPLKVGYRSNWYPLEYTDSETGEPEGAVINMLKRISFISGLKFEYVPISSTDEGEAKLSAGEVDLLASKAMEDGIGENWTLTNSYMINQFNVIGSSDFEDFSQNITVALSKEYKNIEKEILKLFNVNNIIWYSTTEECVSAVNTKKADITFIPSYYQNELLKSKKNRDVKLILNNDISYSMSVAISKNVDLKVVSIIEKCIDTFSSRDISNYVDRINVNQQPGVKVLVKNYWYIFVIIIAAGIAAIISVKIHDKKVINRLNKYDDLTGCYNSKYFESAARSIIDKEKEKHKSNENYYMIKVSLIKYKNIVQYYGEKFGNELLKNVSRQVTDDLKEDEIVGRTGEGKFTILLHGSSIEHIKKRIHNIFDKFRKDFNMEITMFIKSGAYEIKDFNEPVSSMMNKASTARKSIENDPKYFFIKYNDNLKDRIELESYIEFEMNGALEKNEFHIYLQPQINLKTMKIAGAEALLRWIRQDGTMIYPGDCIPVFERSGFIEKVDLYVLELVCSEIRNSLNKGRQIYPIAINQSRYLLTNPEYISNIKRIIDKYKVPSEYIEIEITESMYIENKNQLFSVINDMHNLGIRVSIDDFGSGYSSLNLISEIEADVVKIDRGFLSASGKSASKLKVIKNVVELAHELNMRVVCEGIETEKQEDFLKTIGCDVGQGYLYAKPMSVKDFRAFADNKEL